MAGPRFVGGSDLPKQKEQIGDDVLDLFDYGFSENGALPRRATQRPNECPVAVPL